MTDGEIRDVFGQVSHCSKHWTKWHLLSNVLASPQNQTRKINQLFFLFGINIRQNVTDTKTSDPKRGGPAETRVVHNDGTRTHLF